MKDLKTLKYQKDHTLYASPLEDDILTWCGVIYGPEDTPFEDGTFCLVLFFDNTYPQNPPDVKFISEMFHPNIYSNGVCVWTFLRPSGVLRMMLYPFFCLYNLCSMIQM
jgi:ubiquitin-conjugating enzyme E2 A